MTRRSIQKKLAKKFQVGAVEVQAQDDGDDSVSRICQHFVSGSQATGVDKGACSKRATRHILGFALYDLVDPVMCGRHALFWKDRGYNVIELKRGHKSLPSTPLDQAPSARVEIGMSPAEDRLLTFITSRLESMLRQPAVWGSLLSVEERILQLLEIRRVLLVPSLTANDTHQLLRSYSRFISEALVDATVEPLAVQLEQRGRIVDFPVLMGKFIEHEFSSGRVRQVCQD
jgi:hypothetical protein